METGRYATIDELARAEKINSTYVGRVLQLVEQVAPSRVLVASRAG